MQKQSDARRKTKAAAPTTTRNEPVTLAQVRAMIAAKPASRHALRSGPGGAEVSPDTVGIERRKLLLQQRIEQKVRIRDYKGMMLVMKKRGVKGLAGEVAGGRQMRGHVAVKAVQSTTPLQLFAEGDSWFDYPVPFFGGGIIPRLEDRLGVPILNLAKAGDEVRFMLGVEERRVLEKQLRDGCPAGGPWDVLLFSGGGNDIVDNPMALWVKDFQSGVPPAKLIHQPRFDAALELIRAGYEDLITLRDTLSPSTHLVFHAYDYAIPDGRGICHHGPWLKPTFEVRKFPWNSSVAFEVVKEMLKQFAAVLRTIEINHKDVTVINGQGTLIPNPSSWHNELHPSKEGFKKFADIFHQKLKALFPNRVL